MDESTCQVVQVPARKSNDRLRVLGHRASHVLDELALTAGVHARMGAEDLLHEAGSGARHPSNEDEPIIGVRGVGELCDLLAVEGATSPCVTWPVTAYSAAIDPIGF